jgi:hypothetical protein
VGSDYYWSLPLYWGVNLLALSFTPSLTHSLTHWITISSLAHCTCSI